MSVLDGIPSRGRKGSQDFRIGVLETTRLADQVETTVDLLMNEDGHAEETLDLRVEGFVKLSRVGVLSVRVHRNLGDELFEFGGVVDSEIPTRWDLGFEGVWDFRGVLEVSMLDEHTR